MGKLDKLDKLYQTVDNCEELGLELPNGVIEQITDMEEQLIKDEVLPLIHDNIEPTLRRVKRPLVLVVEYDPEGALQVKLSRKVNIMAQLADAKPLELDPVVEHKTRKQMKPIDMRKPGTTLRITMPDGQVIQEKRAWETMLRFVQAVGVERVRALGLKWCRIPLVSNREDPKYKHAQKPLGGGWLLMTHSGTINKRSKIQRIARSLGLKVKVEII